MMPSKLWLNLLVWGGLGAMACQWGTAALPPSPTLLPPPTAEFSADLPPIPTPPPTAPPYALPPVQAGPPTLPMLGLGPAVPATVGSGEAAVWHVWVPAGANWVVLAQPSASLNVRLQLLGEEGELLAAVDERGQGTAELLRLPSPVGEAARYTVRVAGGGAGTVQVGVWDWSRAAVLAVQGEAGTAEVVTYRLPLAAGQTAIVWLEPQGAWDGLLELYAPNGFIWAQDEAGEGGVEWGVATAVVEGEYLIRVFGYRGQAGQFALRVLAD